MRPILVYNSVKMELGVVPHTFHGVVKVHQKVSYHLRLLFDGHSSSGRRQYEKAAAYWYDVQASIENLLNWAKDRFGGEQLLECLCDDYLDQCMDHQLSTFDPVGILKSLIQGLSSRRSGRAVKQQLAQSVQPPAQHASALFSQLTGPPSIHPATSGPGAR